MATRLYQELGIEATATTEEIRKAYKKKALQTHPDRLPPNSTPAQKAAADEKFRIINNAYEVLADPVKRKEYDFHGVWPPPELGDTPQASGSRPGGFGYQRHSHFDSPFPELFSSHHHTQFSSFAFTDPFALFEAIFSDNTSRPRHRHHFNSPFFDSDPFDHFERDTRREMDYSMPFGPSPFSFFGGFPPRGFISQPHHFTPLPQPSRNHGGGGFVSESHMTQSINGVTQTIHNRRDWDGNEHVTRTYPDGREIYTINGVEQTPEHHGYLPSNTEPRQAPSQHPEIRLLPSESRVGPPPPYQTRSGYMGHNNVQPPTAHAGDRRHSRDQRRSHHARHKRQRSLNASLE